MERSWLTAGDFIDLLYKIKQKRLRGITSRMSFSPAKRALGKWDTVIAGSDFWIIPEVRLRWNEKCTGDPALGYEDYVVQKYLRDASGLRMLSAGCGTGARERAFAKHHQFSLIEGIDQAPAKIAEARQKAAEEGFDNIIYHAADLRSFDLEKKAYDLILFNSSLHHLDRLRTLIPMTILPALKDDGLLVIFEYVGPRRLQWAKEQLEYANNVLRGLPEEYRLKSDGKSVKRRIYRPGWIRMYLNDPSEACESDLILPVIHRYMTVIEEKTAGWDILHCLLKDISHNFLGKDEKTQSLLDRLFVMEDRYLEQTGRSDAVFGVYRKSNASPDDQDIPLRQ